MRRWLVPAGIFLVLAILHTWPIGRSPAHLSLNYNADAELNAWIISWIAHILPTHPTQLFDANIFAPERETLAYSEPLIVPALLTAPVRWLGGSPVLAFNLGLIAGLMLTALAGWFVVDRWTGSTAAGLVAGSLAAFNAHLLTRLPHLQAAHAWALPLAFYFADRLVDRRDMRAAIALAVTIAAVAATSAYWLVFACAIVAIVIVVNGRLRPAIMIAAATAAGLVIAMPVLLPYVRLAASGETRPLEVVSQFAAAPADYLAAAARVHAWWSVAFSRQGGTDLFPGIAAIGLACAGAWAAFRDGGPSRRRAIALIVVAICGIVLSFGPSTFIYRWLYEWVEPLRGLRAAARFGFLFLVAVALLAGLGVAWLERRMASATTARTLAIAALVLVTAEAWRGPVTTVPFPGVSSIYKILVDDVRTPVVLVEVPFYPGFEAFENGEYVLNSTAHWRPLMNGYSGFTPMSYRRRADAFWFFPEDWAIRAIHDEGATHVMVHLARFGSQAPDVVRALEGRSDLRLIARDRDGRMLYEVVR
jgi:hypothetical protein